MSAESKEAADREKKKKKNKKVTIGILIKREGGKLWKRFSKAEKEVYAVHAEKTRGSRSRSLSGKFQRECAAPVEMPPQSPEAELEEPEPDPDPFFVTPKKDQNSSRKARKKFSNAVVQEIANVLQSEESPMKQGMIEIVGRAAEASGLGMNRRGFVRAHGRLMKCRRSVLGRKAGSTKLSDADLQKQLEQVSQPTSMIHLGLGVPIRTLECSKRRAATTMKKTMLLHSPRANSVSDFVSASLE